MTLKQQIKEMLGYATLTQPTRAKCSTIARSAWVLSSFLLATFACAGDLGKLDSRLKQAKTIKSVAVSIGARDYDFVKRFPQYSCTFASSNPKKIADLLKSFTQSNTRQIRENDAFVPIVEVEIHFTFADGKEDVLYLGKRYLGENTIDGELIIDGHEHSSFLRALRNLSERILVWAQKSDSVIMSKDLTYPDADTFIQRCRDEASGNNMPYGVGRCPQRKTMLSNHEYDLCVIY